MNNEFRTLVFEMKNTRSNLINQERTREASAMFFEERARKANTLFQQLGYMSTKEDNVFGKRAKELDVKKDTIQQTTVIDEVLDEVLNGKQYQIATTTRLVDLDKIMRNKELHNYHYDAAIAIIVLVNYIIDKKLNLTAIMILLYHVLLNKSRGR